MANRIKVLSDLVINQIAAGEVIERPASVLKELVENSLDANSSMIKIYIENGGRSLIKVIDNGHGIHPDDLALAVMQHATSKIMDTADLSSISSLGFRGEALASIAAVSKVNIISRQLAPSGTTIEVKDIFYNLPVRKKFLRSSTTEYNYLQEIFKRIALSKFNVGFMLYHNHKLVKNLPAIKCLDLEDNLEKKAQRISKLIGSKFITNAIFLNSKINNMRLCGWLSKGGDVAGTQVQYLYINNRIVKDKLLNMAIKQALGASFIVPAYCLYLYIEATFVDVNVHPTKQEVRFSDPNMIYAFVNESVLEAIKKFEVIASPANYNVSNLEQTSYHQIFKNKLQDALIAPFTHKQHLDHFVPADTPNIPNYDHNVKAVNALELIPLNYKMITAFNHKYLIFELLEHPEYLGCIDIRRSIKWLIQHKLNKIDHKFNLVIPERVQCDLDNLVDVNLKLEYLGNLKFTVDQIHSSVLLIRAIPECLNLLNIHINYAKFFQEFLQAKNNQFNEHNINTKQWIINLLLANLELPELALYSKKDLFKLLAELISSNYKFRNLSETEFTKILEFS